MAILIISILCASVVYFFFRKNRLSRLTNAEKLPNALKIILNTRVPYYQKLDKADKGRFEIQVNDFLKYVRIEGVGTTLTDIDRALIASSGVIPIFGFPGWKYNNLTNIILYPDTFDQEFQFEGENRNIMGMVGSGYMNGQMLLSRAALLKGFSSSSGKGNTAIHEFVHLLDKSDGETDGVPENLLPHQYTVPWLKMMHQEMHRIEAGKSDIDVYASTNETEFLAVAAEYFFEKPDQLKHKHPEIYDLLSQMFGQDPALPVSSPLA
ncbi:zinc-dependent peptidase [uncultured Mucilaginibacter sp.]|uniref:M90 family metallopeptidase n=1 Tax=uncultured Mucilaginibacter sp. TaxID=797541 RepID=UPI0025FA90ED|nr:M90 family metallopeptidase [uncultured Mucilaginibacter sp.]